MCVCVCVCLRVCKPGFTRSWSSTVRCFGSCCGNLSVDAISGTLSDGPGDYLNDQTCRLLITTRSYGKAPEILLAFSLLDIEVDYDFVTLYDSDCGANCTNDAQMVRLSGRHEIRSPSNLKYASSTGVLLVEFEADTSITSSGFSADWIIGGALPAPCISCPAGKYKTSIGPRDCEACPEGTFSPAGATTCTTTPSNAASIFMSKELAHCSLGLTWKQILELRKTAKGRISTGGLGKKIIPGLVKVWVCDRSLAIPYHAELLFITLDD